MTDRDRMVACSTDPKWVRHQFDEDRFVVLEGEAERNCIAMVRDKIKNLKPAGDLARWERGWAENLEAYRKTGDVATLRPRYIRDGQPLRLGGKFMIASDPDFEMHWYEGYREHIANRWLADAYSSIWEFGCGSGHNVAWLAKRFPDKTIVGSDWSQASYDICIQMRIKGVRNVCGQKFDFFNPLNDPPNTLHNNIALTIGALEQTGNRWRPFLDYLLAAKPRRVVHIEPMVEWYDATNPVDQTAIEHHKARGYWEGYYKAIVDLVAEGRAIIECAEPETFGSLFICGYSRLVWRPV